MDSLRVYTFDFINRAPSNYLIGQNFLKRFNVFFDMKHQRIGFQPIPNFTRVVNPLHQRFHILVEKIDMGGGSLLGSLILRTIIIKLLG
ncbi:hypothetical protein ACIXO6_19585 [Bacteroides fragilis]